MPSVLDWWFDQLTGLMPARFARAATKPSDAVILELDRQIVRPIIRLNGARTRVSDLGADAKGVQDLCLFLAAESNLPRAIVLRLPASQVLHKHVTLPAAAKRDLQQVLGFEIDRETPFTRDEVYWTYYVQQNGSAEGRFDVDLLLVPRAFADPYITELKRAGIEPAGIEVDVGSGLTTLIRLAPQKREPWLRIERPLLPLAGAAAALAVLVLITPFLVQQWVLVSADTAMASLTGPAKEAATLRQTVDTAIRAADFLTAERSRNRSAVEILAAVTDALPDDTYLTSLSIRGGKVTMSGFSSSAADLIGVLADAPGFASPAFDAPVVRDETNSLERFTISVALAPAGAS